MQSLYQLANLPDFEQIQKELLECIDHDWTSRGLNAFSYPEAHMEERCPTLMAWLKPRSKVAFSQFRFYVTPPHSFLEEHIDGGGVIPTCAFNLNIPVANTKNTTFTWYKTDPSNLEVKKINGRASSFYAKDRTILEPLDKLEITAPVFVKTDILHGVQNPNDTFRLMFTVRWPIKKDAFRTIEECLITDDIFK